MQSLKPAYLLIAMIIMVIIAANSNAEDNTCRLKGPSSGEIWVKVYDVDADGMRDKLLWEGMLEATKEVPITSTHGHIRIDYRSGSDEMYSGDVSKLCVQNNVIPFM